MAVLVYLGVGISAYPTRIPDAVDEYFGADRAPALRKRVDDLLHEAWRAYPGWQAMS